MKKEEKKTKTLFLSSAQENIEHMMLAYQESELCNMGGFFWLNSRREAKCARTMLSYMPMAHGALRLCYLKKGRLKENEAAMAEVPVIVCSAKEEKEKERIMEEWVRTPFVLSRALCEFAIFSFGDHTWAGAEKFHHLIMDKTSLLLLIKWQRETLRKLMEVGEAAVLKELTLDRSYLRLLEAPPKYHTLKEQTEKWLKAHFGLSDPHGKGRTALSSKAEVLNLRIPEKLCQELRQRSEMEKVSTESIIWYAAFFVEMLHRTGKKQGVIGRMLEYRRQKEKEIVGLFSRVLPIPFRIQEGGLMGQCSYLMEQFLVGMRYGEYSLAQLKQLAPERELDFELLISYHPQRLLTEKGAEYREVLGEGIDTPLRVWINDAVKTGELTIFYQIERFPREQVRKWGERVFFVLEQLLGGIRADQVSLLTEADRMAYQKLNAEIEVDPKFTVSQQFLLRGAKYYQEQLESRTKSIDEKNQEDLKCHDVFLKDQHSIWSYEDALLWFYQAVDWLREHGAGRGAVVLVCMERSVMLPVFLLAVLHCKAAFLPVSVTESKRRKEELRKEAAIFAGEDERKEISSRNANPKTSENIWERAFLDTRKKWDKKELQNERAYILYTSGSTGAPKAVQISQYSLMCRLQWAMEKYGCGRITLQKTVTTFDVSLWELFLPLIYGGRLYLLREGAERLPDEIADTIKKERITRVHFVPSMLEAFLNYLCKEEGERKKSWELEEIFVSGEELRAELAKRVFLTFPKVRLINLYGPTECTIDVSYHECHRGERKIPIGKAVANTRLFLMPPDSEEILPIGVEGELCVFGDLVGMGYAKEEQGGFCEVEKKDGGTERYPAGRMYRTGDFCVLEEDGELYYRGRRDQQEKLRGMRVDLGSIEHAILKHPDIRACHVLIHDHRLEAFYEAGREVENPAGFLEPMDFCC